MTSTLARPAIFPACRPQHRRAVALQVFSLLLVCGAANGCSNGPTSDLQSDLQSESLAETTNEATTIVTSKSEGLDSAELQRVIVTLKPLEQDNPTGSTAQSDDVTSPMDAAVSALTAKYPGAKVLRTMPGFSQFVVELPGEQLGAFEREPMVLSAKPDKTYRPLQRSPNESQNQNQ